MKQAQNQPGQQPAMGSGEGPKTGQETRESKGALEGVTLGATPGWGPSSGSQDNNTQWPGLNPPRLSTGEEVSGVNKRQYKREKKANRIQKQLQQEPVDHWLNHEGNFELPDGLVMGQRPVEEYVGQMCPAGLALHHPAAATLLEYATQGCPCKTGRPWTIQEM